MVLKIYTHIILHGPDSFLIEKWWLLVAVAAVDNNSYFLFDDCCKWALP